MREGNLSDEMLWQWDDERSEFRCYLLGTKSTVTRTDSS